jgi:hypothetical protein
MGLLEIAQEARKYIFGVDWDQVRADSGLDEPAEDLIYDAWPEYTAQLQIAWERANYVMQKLALAWEVPLEQIGPVKAALDDELINKESQFWAAVNLRYNFLADEQSIAIETEKFRLLLSKMWLNAMEIAVGHKDAIYQLASDASPAEIISSADNVHAFFEGIVYLYDHGYLDPLRKTGAALPPNAPGVAGLGAAVAVPWYIIGWVLVAAIAILAAYLLLDAHLERQAELVRDCWERAQRETDPERRELLLQLCSQQQADLSKAETFDPFGVGKALNTVAVVIGVGLLAYGAVMLTPELLRGMKRRRQKRAQRELGY